MLYDKNKILSFNVCTSQEYSDATVKQNEEKKTHRKMLDRPSGCISYKALLKY